MYMIGREDVYDLKIKGLEARFFNSEFQSHSVSSSSHNADGSSRRHGPDSEKSEPDDNIQTGHLKDKELTIQDAGEDGFLTGANLCRW